jgi:DNA-binding transcriptional LysR family regulator
MNPGLLSKSGLSLDRLASFGAVAEAGSIVKAAGGDPVRQSLMSRQIRELEEFFGVELTRRQGKGLVITPAGQRLAALVRAQIQDLDDFHREAAGTAREFSIGAGSSTLEWLVVPAARRLAPVLGGAVVRLVSDRSRELVAAVREGRLDFAILRNDALPASAPRRRLVKLGFLLCVPASLLPKGKPAAGPAEPALWRALPFAAAGGGGQLDSAIRRAMADAGVDFRPAFECSSMLQVRQLVADGVCAAVLPTLGARNLPGVLAVPFAPLKDYGRTLVLHWNDRHCERRAVAASAFRALAEALKWVAEPSPV